MRDYSIPDYVKEMELLTRVIEEPENEGFEFFPESPADDLSRRLEHLLGLMNC